MKNEKKELLTDQLYLEISCDKTNIIKEMKEQKNETKAQINDKRQFLKELKKTLCFTKGLVKTQKGTIRLSKKTISNSNAKKYAIVKEIKQNKRVIETLNSILDSVNTVDMINESREKIVSLKNDKRKVLEDITKERENLETLNKVLKTLKEQKKVEKINVKEVRKTLFTLYLKNFKQYVKLNKQISLTKKLDSEIEKTNSFIIRDKFYPETKKR